LQEPFVNKSGKRYETIDTLGYKTRKENQRHIDKEKETMMVEKKERRRNPKAKEKKKKK
jgi:hypothetical protein